MAIAVEFEGQTTYLKGDGCYDLPVAIQPTKLAGIDVPEIISAWQLSPEELQQVVANGGVVFLRVIGGQPPCEVTGINPIRG